MTPEELAETIDGANVNYAPDISCDDWQAMAKALLAHINQQAAEVERLRSENKIISDRAAHHEKQDAAEIELLAARIKELEEANRNIDKRRDEMAAFIERLEAAFLEAETERKFYTTVNGMNSEFDWNGYPECPRYGIHKEWFRQHARKALEIIKEGGKDE